jgi:HB1, ASXL, restriction endonuclease HTH domain
MTYLQAAITVLEDSQRPLSTSEIMAEISRRDLIQATGKTPERTLAAALYRGIGKHPRLRRDAEEGDFRALYGSVRWYVVP